MGVGVVGSLHNNLHNNSHIDQLVIDFTPADSSVPVLRLYSTLDVVTDAGRGSLLMS